MRNSNSSNPTFLEEEVFNRSLTALGNRSMNRNNTLHTIEFFKKYVPLKVHNNPFSSNEQEPADANVSRRSLTSGIEVLQFGQTPSNLEKMMFPGLRTKQAIPEPAAIASNSNCSKGQLTIFYAGAINVYDNVPDDKAEAIMLLAGGSSSSNTFATTSPTEPVHSSKFASIMVPTRPLPCLNLPSVTIRAPPLPTTNAPPVHKLEAGLHIARKHSLQRFLEKRRDRITNKSPYASPKMKQENDEPALDGCSTADQTVLQSLFPSHLRCHLPVASLHIV